MTHRERPGTLQLVRLVATLAVLSTWSAVAWAAPEGGAQAPAASASSPEAAVPEPPVSGNVPEPAPTAAVPPVVPRATPGECVPECRSGFQCVSGQCVSDRNPPCGTGALCTAQKTCVLDVKEALEKAAADERQFRLAASARNHDGMYFRLGLGAGYALDSARVNGFETKSHGLGTFFDEAAGVTAGPVVFGFEFAFLGVSAPSTTQAGITFGQNHSDFYSLFGFLVDVYPDTHKGLHFGATVGIGTADINPRKNESNGAGFGMLVGGGYDFWIADQFSLGLTGRLLYLGGPTDDFGTHHTFIPLLAASVLLN